MFWYHCSHVYADHVDIHESSDWVPLGTMKYNLIKDILIYVF